MRKNIKKEKEVTEADLTSYEAEAVNPPKKAREGPATIHARPPSMSPLVSKQERAKKRDR
jgi:hypothetical protein